MDCTVLDRRKIMVQTYFCCRVNRKCDNPLAQLDRYNSIFGHPDKSTVQDTNTSLSDIYAVSSWGAYFERLYLKSQNDQFVKNILVESMGRAKDKRYFTPSYTPTQPYEPENTQDDLPQQQSYEEAVP